MNEKPLVSVVTPVHNREDFLAECMESVLGQTYENLEYLIVDDCSTDRSAEIALSYARKDPRIRVHMNKRVEGIIPSHNIAFSLMSSEAKYCKVVSDFDFLFPHCLVHMVELAEAHPSVGIVGSYQLSGSIVKWQGFEFPRVTMSGVEMCRRMFLSQGEPGLAFGSPTSTLYRADLVRKRGEFFPNTSPHADASACFETLKSWDFGFVYQVLSYARTHGETESSLSTQINRFASANLNDLIQYGPYFLSKDELEQQLKRQLSAYHRYLAANVFRSRPKEFWAYHRERLEELGHPLKASHLLKAGLKRIGTEVVNPGQALGKVLRRNPGLRR